MPQLPSCCDAFSWKSEELQAAIYCILTQINAAVGGDPSADQYVSHPTRITGDDITIPTGARSWSMTVISGIVTIQPSGQPQYTVPVGGSLSGGGYGAAGLQGSILISAAAGDTLVQYDTKV